MGLTLITPPTVYPVTLAEAKAHCRVDSADEEALITGLIAAATSYVEEYTGRSLCPQTWKLTLDAFTPSILLPRGPVASVTSVEYYDPTGSFMTVSTDDYVLDNANFPAWIVVNNAWPETLDAINSVQITYVTGETAPPAPIKQAILLLIGQWFDERSAVAGNLSPMPNGVEALLANYRSFSL